MASDWREWRLIVVDGRRFRWQCQFEEPWLNRFDTPEERRQGRDSILVRLEAHPERTLRVCWPRAEGPVVTPRLVRLCIEEALRRGWLGSVPTMSFAYADVPVTAD